MRQQLAAVADAENGNPQLEDLRIGLGRLGIIDAVGAAGENNANGIQGFDVRDRGGIGLDLAVYAAFPHAPCDQLVILSAEVKDQNHL